MKSCYVGAALSLVLGASPVAAAPVEPSAASSKLETSGQLPLEAFFERPTYSRASLSPDGRFLAFAYSPPGADQKDTTVVAVERLDDAHIDIVTKFSAKGSSVRSLDWKDNNRLLIGIHEFYTTRTGDKPGSYVVNAKLDDLLIAIDRDGKNALQLLKPYDPLDRQRISQVYLMDRLKDDPDHILAVGPDLHRLQTAYKVNVRTGESELVEQGRTDVSDWQTDSTGAIVARTRRRRADWVIESRAAGQAIWTEVATVNKDAAKMFEDFRVFGAAELPNQLYVSARSPENNPDDIRELKILDVKTKKLSDPIFPNMKHDVDSVIYDDDHPGRLAGACYTADTKYCDFLDAGEAAQYRGLVKYFGSNQSVYLVSVKKSARWWLVNVSGPSSPGAYYIYDTKTAQIELMGEQYSYLPEARLGKGERYAYRARDGVSIPGYLTRPPGAASGPLPLIVMPHGGPEQRDSLTYDFWVQILATRGYLVFQPNFRGSNGYGAAYATAGYKQWGGRMADDITDGVRSLIESGQVDPARICIFGASYGGYAALYAGAKHPELYKCVVSWAGLSDLRLSMAEVREAYGKDSPPYRYWLKSIGDPETEAENLKSASPVTYAAGYQPPVFLIHGDADHIVNADQSRVMDRALSSAGHKPKLVIFADEGHPHWDPANEKTAWGQIVDFIEQHIAPAPQVVAGR
jgi:dipeptidyl aminopeptidase/acylaminoacyl peptidase